MADYIINESGMDFIANTGDTYQIEKSHALASVGSNVKTVEFIRQLQGELRFVEAKFDKDFTGKFNERKREICDKFLHSLNLYCSVMLGVTVDSIPFVYDKTRITLVLVINDCDKNVCIQIKEVLKSMLNPYLKIWKADVSVLNLGAAKKYKLIH
jgi:hypothetical protein